MNRPGFAGEWQVVASTSHLFPVRAKVEVTQKTLPGAASFALAVTWEKHEIQLFEKDFPEDPPGTFRGGFKHPKDSDEELEISVTVSLGPLDRKYLFGVVREPGLIDPGGTGFWVAEEPPTTS